MHELCDKYIDIFLDGRTGGRAGGLAAGRAGGRSLDQKHRFLEVTYKSSFGALHERIGSVHGETVRIKLHGSF